MENVIPAAGAIAHRQEWRAPLKSIYTAPTMQLTNPKSFVAGVMLLALPLRALVAGFEFHGTALHDFNVIIGPIAAAFCFWHTFNGKRPLLGGSEIRASLILGGVSAALAAGASYTVLKRHFHLLDMLLVVIYVAGATFYFWQALKEQRLSEP
jgi:hypothetical protein